MLSFNIEGSCSFCDFLAINHEQQSNTQPVFMRPIKRVDDSTSSSEATADPAPPAQKKRKPTYYIRKEMIEKLQEQVQLLQHELAQAEATSSLTPKRSKAQFNADIERHHRLFAGLESLLSSYKQGAWAATLTPLVSFIHLPKDHDDRERIQASLHRPKLDVAYRFMIERTRFFDLHTNHVHEELIHLPNSDVTAVRLDVTTLDARYSLSQVYEALKFVVANQETLCPRSSVHDPTRCQAASLEDFAFGQVMLSIPLPCDLQVESNSVTFMRSMELENDNEQLHPYAIVMSDYVDVDDRHPHRSMGSVLKQLTSAILVREVATPTGSVVSLAKWQHVRFVAPKFRELTTQQVDCLHETLRSEWDEMMRVIHERLTALW